VVENVRAHPLVYSVGGVGLRRLFGRSLLQYYACMATRTLVLFGTLGALALTPAVASAQSPFEEDGATSPPASTKTVAPPAPPRSTDSSSEDEDDDDAVESAPTPKPTAGPRPRLTESPARGFRVVSYAKEITLDLRSPNRGATFSMQSGSSRGTVSTFGTTIGPRGRMSFSTSTGVTSSASYERVCTAPCTVEVDAGIHRLQLELPDGRIAETDRLHLSRDATVVAQYNSYSGTRVALAVTGALALITGLVLDMSALSSPSPSDSKVFWPGLLMIVSSGVFIEIATQIEDSVDVKVIDARQIPRIDRP